MNDAELHQIKHRLTGAVLFEGRHGSLRGCVEAAVWACADLADANLARANLAGADLARADLARANLAGAYLMGANLARADLAGANLAGANLAGAYLVGADLARANLAGANLAGADLTGADLTGATWRDGIPLTRAPIVVDNLDDGWRVTILDAHMQIGCECHTFADWRTFDDARIVAMDGRRALKFWRRYGPALLAMCDARAQS